VTSVGIGKWQGDQYIPGNELQGEMAVHFGGKYISLPPFPVILIVSVSGYTTPYVPYVALGGIIFISILVFAYYTLRRL